MGMDDLPSSTWSDELKTTFKSDFDNANDAFKNAFADGVSKDYKISLAESWNKLKESSFSSAGRINFINLKQRNIIDTYAGNIADATNARKGNFGEIGADLDLNSKGYESLMPRIDDIDAPNHNGLDGVYRKGGQIYIVEGKYRGSASLNSANDATGLARQMSDEWITSRDWSNVNLTDDIIQSLLDTKSYTRLLAKSAPDGTVTYSLVDEFGYVITGDSGTFNP